MSDINNAVVGGRLTRDPELRRGNSGVPWATFTIAANHRYKTSDGEREEVAFLNCVMFGKPAEWASEHKRGDHVVVCGRLRTTSWESDGKPHSRLELVVQDFRFFPAKNGGQQLTKEGSSESELVETDRPPF